VRQLRLDCTYKLVDCRNVIEYSITIKIMTRQTLIAKDSLSIENG
jgi:hypothetical protein